ncbi:class 1b ribonucleoside-diphosphate reductase subunit beta [Lacticaseibacillus pabuli]|uniref:ribonucleoside-diphosphate reductase n=1 Tax=Lacticaseibacillus pabuli TaxID=3025672 RepID=A0ABY7WSC9_9LACO|nr:class 1b ribonucleoside-diphosphate reductase subunit beta [Lacticaseibacillus sp. KACC 23028]WDF81892.1 class 1b ribonucleoside-diphosphate reductase subunit beta [Lacticaseibacillus sp. KACC 23028]
MTDKLSEIGNYKAINWDRVSDDIDKATWEKLTEQFWLDTRIPVSNDMDDWRELDDTHQWVVGHVFGGLTLLDTVQSQDGMRSLSQDAITPHEKAVLNNIQFMESVHAKSYSTIFSTLNTQNEIDEIFNWSDTEDFLQNKAKWIVDIYRNDPDSLHKKVANVFLETCLFYSGFYTPLYYLGNNKLNNVAEIIKLILRDESVHGTYIGYKYQVKYSQLTDREKQAQDDWAYDFLYKLFENEQKYAALCYDQVGWTDEVMTFVQYNANKALMNLGKEGIFPTTASDVNPIIMNGINTTTSNHDFFSQVGNGYLLGQVEAMSDDDYNIGIADDPKGGDKK